MSTHSERAWQWACDVVEGIEPRCLFIRQACQRFIDDFERGDDWRYEYDVESAENACNWIECLPHTKGKWAAKNELFELQPWQSFVVCNIFGWLDKVTGNRRFREFYGEVPRKNGKSLLAAAIGQLMAFADGEFGAEVYSGATSEKQAWEVFKPARLMVVRDEELREEHNITVAAKSLFNEIDGSKFEPMIGKPGDGASPHCGIIDEFHEHDTSDQVDTMVTGMGAREQPLLFIITTAGVDFAGPCKERREDCIKILNGAFDDDTVFAMIFTVDADDDWSDVATAKKANPNWGVSVNAEFITAQLEGAKRSASKQTAYKTKHLNQWVGAKAVWLNMLALKRCENPSLDLDDFEGEFCILGLDLASKVDLASLTMLFSDGQTVTQFNKHYLPYDTVYGEDTPNIRYRQWAEVGLLEVTDGAVTDFDVIEDDIRECCRRFNVHEIAFDPYQATQLASHLLAEDLPMVEVGATVRNFSEPMKELESIIIATSTRKADTPQPKSFQYNGDQVLTWQYGNVVAQLDAKDNIYPRKERVENKIDGVVSCIMAMNRLISLTDDSAAFNAMLENPLTG